MCSGYSCQDLSKKLTPEQYRITQEKGTERVTSSAFRNYGSLRFTREGFYRQIL